MIASQPLYTKLFWLDARDRAIKTFAQTVVTISAVYIPSISLSNTGDLQAGVVFGLQTLPWILLAGVGGAALSVLTSLASARVSGTDTASLTVDTKPLVKE